MKLEDKQSYDLNLELIEKYRAGDAEAGEKLCIINRPLVLSISSRFSGRGQDPEELYDVGVIGLVKAINSFDLTRGCAFSTYAVPLIFGEIRRFLRDDGMIKVSREQKRLAAELSRERERRKGLGEEPSVSVLAEAVGVSVQDASAALSAASPVRSLEDQYGSPDDGLRIADQIFDEDEESRTFEHLALRMAIERLDEHSRRLITLRYFRDFSQVETARILGISQVKVSREEKRIMERLRALLS